MKRKKQSGHLEAMRGGAGTRQYRRGNRERRTEHKLQPVANPLIATLNRLKPVLENRLTPVLHPARAEETRVSRS